MRDVAHLSDALIAKATGARPSTVRDWFAGRAAVPTGEARCRAPGIELSEMTDRLAARDEGASTSRSGCSGPVPGASIDEKPIELLARRGLKPVATDR